MSWRKRPSSGFVEIAGYIKSTHYGKVPSPTISPDFFSQNVYVFSIYDSFVLCELKFQTLLLPQIASILFSNFL